MTNALDAWNAYVREELSGLAPMLKELGFELDAEQPHLGGERYLMHAVTTASGRKLILLATETRTKRRVVIKATSDGAGARELLHEHHRRRALNRMPFAYTAFLFPEEVLFTRTRAYTISAQEFVAQECSFLERPVERQFALSLASFKAQEGARAITGTHVRLIRRTFGMLTAQDYIDRFKDFEKDILALVPGPSLAQALAGARETLQNDWATIEQYGGFLTHTDFVPHNFRVADGRVYLLDHSSLRFGNKYEGMARFLNFMTLHNPALEEAFQYYVRENRTPEETVALKLMRLYRLGELLWYYANTLDRSVGDLHSLNRARIDWWQHVLDSALQGTAPDPQVRTGYIGLRDRLRSPDEKRRQQGLH